MLAKSTIASVLCLGQLALALPQPQTSSSGNGTSIADLVQDVDACVRKCIRENASQVNCGSSDLSCLCSKDPTQFKNILQSCVLNGCEDLSVAIAAPPKISKVCDAVKDSPSTAELDAAEKVLAGSDSNNSTGSGSGSGSDDGGDEGAAVGLAANGLLVAVVALLLL